MHRVSVLMVALGLAIGGLSWPAATVAQESAPSPSIAKDSRVFELRTYTVPPGKLDLLQSRFREATMRLFEKHGMTNVAYWVPKDKPDTLVYVLAHKSRAAAAASWKAFIADPEWQAVLKASDVSAGVRLPSKIESVFMDATDYSPLK
jgi:hypothetical protein